MKSRLSSSSLWFAIAAGLGPTRNKWARRAAPRGLGSMAIANAAAKLIATGIDRTPPGLAIPPPPGRPIPVASLCPTGAAVKDTGAKRLGARGCRRRTAHTTRPRPPKTLCALVANPRGLAIAAMPYIPLKKPTTPSRTGAKMTRPRQRPSAWCPPWPLAGLIVADVIWPPKSQPPEPSPGPASHSCLTRRQRPRPPGAAAPKNGSWPHHLAQQSPDGKRAIRARCPNHWGRSAATLARAEARKTFLRSQCHGLRRFRLTGSAA